MAKVFEERQLTEKIEEAISVIRKHTSLKPSIGIILGTGLAATLINKIKVDATIKYSDIPHFPTPTVAFHSGNLVFGELAGKKVVVMDGRFHYYEGFTLGEITFPVRVMKRLGVKIMIVTNAAGGLNKNFRKSDVVAIEDHINFMGVNPVVGPHEDKLGPRFVDMCEP
ncbi:MAG: purine-nucleoside phosphorylase, partial [Candidatus Omnitrophica bacterium]|nr:purine-nucleoside phosphorylase [Candidatus Omnitrophota bacterium]